MTHRGWTSGEEKCGVLEKRLRRGEVGHDHGLYMLGARREKCNCSSLDKVICGDLAGVRLPSCNICVDLERVRVHVPRLLSR